MSFGISRFRLHRGSGRVAPPADGARGVPGRKIRGAARRTWVGRTKVVSLLVLALVTLCQGQPGQIVGWGTLLGSRHEPKAGDEYMAIAAGGYHGLALRADGTLVAWGENSNGQCNTPLGRDFTAIATGLYHNLALKADGTVVAWGDNSRGQCHVPARTKFLAIAAGAWHSLGIQADGSLVAWGWNEHGQCEVPPGTDYLEISGGYYHSVALKADRSIVAWGATGDGQCNVPAGRDFVHVAAGAMHNVALKTDGTLAAWGRDSERQCRVPAGSDFIAIAAGSFHGLALQQNGQVEAWGQNEYAQCDTPATDRYAVIAAGGFHCLAIRDNRSPEAGPLRNGRLANAIQTRPPQPRPAPAAQPKGDDATAPLVSYSRPEETRTTPPPAAATLTVAELNAPANPMSIQHPPVSVASTPAPEPAPETRGAPGGSAKTETKPSNPPEKPAVAKQTSAPEKPLTSRSGTTAKPAPATEPNSPVDLNDLVRQGLAADLYLDASQHAVPVYHFTSVSSTRHFCTISEEEKYRLIDSKPAIWKYEGIAFFAYPEGYQPPGSRPVYRFRSESLNRYFFTLDEAQKQLLVDKFAKDWKYEGIAWYAPPVKTGKK